MSTDELLGDDLRERLDEFLDTHTDTSAVIVPPMSSRTAGELLDWDEDGEHLSRLYALSDLADAHNKVTDPTMAQIDDWDEETGEFVPLDEPSYPLTDEGVERAKLASLTIYQTYRDELVAFAEDLGVADDPKYERGDRYDYVRAIRDYFGYERPDYHEFIRSIADKVDATPEEVYEVLDEEFDGYVDFFEFTGRNPVDEDFSSVEEVAEALNLDDEEETD